MTQLIGDSCKCWGKLVNPIKIKTLGISRSKTLGLIFSNMLLNGTLVKRLTKLKVLCVVFDTKLLFDSQTRSIAASASSKLGILRKSLN